MFNEFSTPFRPFALAGTMKLNVVRKSHESHLFKCESFDFKLLSLNEQSVFESKITPDSTPN